MECFKNVYRNKLDKHNIVFRCVIVIEQIIIINGHLPFQITDYNDEVIIYITVLINYYIHKYRIWYIYIMHVYISYIQYTYIDLIQNELIYIMCHLLQIVIIVNI